MLFCFLIELKCLQALSEGGVVVYLLESLYRESSVNLWFERHFVSKKFHCYAVVLFMHGKNMRLFNRKNLNAILFPNFQTLLALLSL